MNIKFLRTKLVVALELMNRYMVRLYNEVSDELARLESALDISERPLLEYFFGKIKQFIQDKTNQTWMNRTGCKVSRQYDQPWTKLRRIYF